MVDPLPIRSYLVAAIIQAPSPATAVITPEGNRQSYLGLIEQQRTQSSNSEELKLDKAIGPYGEPGRYAFMPKPSERRVGDN